MYLRVWFDVYMYVFVCWGMLEEKKKTPTEAAMSEEALKIDRDKIENT